MSQQPPNNLVHGALIEAEILTSPSPHVFSNRCVNLAQTLGARALPTGVAPLPKYSRNVPMCLSSLQKVFGAWGPNRSWDIDLPAPPCICSTWPGFCALAHLWLQVYQHLPSGLKYSYASQEPENKIWCMGP